MSACPEKRIIAKQGSQIPSFIRAVDAWEVVTGALKTKTMCSSAILTYTAQLPAT